MKSTQMLITLLRKASVSAAAPSATGRMSADEALVSAHRSRQSVTFTVVVKSSDVSLAFDAVALSRAVHHVETLAMNVAAITANVS